VIKGWEIGIATMARGEVARLHCTANYAYGEAGLQPAVPPNAVLVFDVEMLDFKGESCVVYYTLFNLDFTSSVTTAPAVSPVNSPLLLF